MLQAWAALVAHTVGMGRIASMLHCETAVAVVATAGDVARRLRGVLEDRMSFAGKDAPACDKVHHRKLWADHVVSTREAEPDTS